MKQLFIVCVLIGQLVLVQTTKVQAIEIGAFIKGSLYETPKAKKPNLIIITAGSGMTDRDGNGSGLNNNSLKFLAQSLQSETAVFAYDKSVFQKIKSSNFEESTHTFQDNVDDLLEIINYFKNQKKYKHIILLGHSEGALVSLLATHQADGLISLAGAGRSIDKILYDQLMAQAPMLKDDIEKGLQSLKNQETFANTNPFLEGLFRPSVQPYLMSWMQIEPTEVIQKLDKPTLIINGTKDIQVSENEATLLKAAQPKADLVIIENMNHVLKNIKGELTENYQSYTKADLPIHEDLPKAILEFMKQHF